MGVQVQQFTQIQGMNQDLAPSKRTDKLAYEIKNMRVTTNNGSTLLTWTNEQGTKQIPIYKKEDPTVEATITGKILGTCTLNNYLVLFVKTDNYDYIYGINFNNTPLILLTFYRGKLNFQYDSKFETIGVYENSSIQKIYWIDGINQPRFINIAEDIDKIQSGQNTQFDFIPTDDKVLNVTIEKQYKTGVFKAGTIQYACNYYNENGAQTNLVYISPIQYIASTTRGHAVDDRINCAFKLRLSNINLNFDYLRIYAISRTSIDTTPQVTIVKDIALKDAKFLIDKVSPSEETSEEDIVALEDNEEEEDITEVVESTNENAYIECLDNGMNGVSFDYTALLFMNNTPIIPQTMEQKDNTLFLGNLQYNASLHNTLKTYLDANNKLNPNEFIEFIHVNIESNTKKQYYPHSNQLELSADKILGFKGGESYLFGIILQDTFNVWTSIIPLGILKNIKYPQVVETETSYDTKIVQATLSSTFISTLKKLLKDFETLYGISYKTFQIVIVEQTDAQRAVLCQGIVNPTMYGLENRINGKLPYVQSSWFFRPMLLKAPEGYDDVDSGAVLEWRHYYPQQHETQIPIDSSINTGLGIPNSSDGSSIGRGSITIEDIGKYPTNFIYCVDNQILTFHSPDIEFNSTIQSLLTNNSIYKFRIVGYTKIHSTYSDSEIILKNNSKMTTRNGEPYEGKVYTNIGKQYNTFNQKYPFAGLVSWLGASGYCSDCQYPKHNENGTISSTLLTGEIFNGYYQVFPWNRHESINIQKTTTDENPTWDAPIDTKIMSNFRCCGKTVMGRDHYWRPSININSKLKYTSNIEIWNKGTSLIKLQDNNIPWSNELSYLGDVDTVLTGPENGYQLNVVTANGTPNVYFNKVNHLIQMKYKSSPHAVFSLGFWTYQDNWQEWVLPCPSTPSLDNSLPTYNDIHTVAWGKNMSVENTALDAYKEFYVYDATNDSNINYSVADLSSGVNYKENVKKVIDYLYSKYPKWFFVQEYKQPTGNIRNGFIGGQEGIFELNRHIILLLNNIDLDTYEFAKIYYRERTYMGRDGKKVTSIIYNDGESTSTTTERSGSSYNRTTSIQDNKIYANDIIQDYTNENKLYIVNSDNIISKYIYQESDYGAQGERKNSPIILDRYPLEEGDDGIFYIGELYQENSLSMDNFDLTNYNWQIASDVISIDDTDNIILYGDTYYQRYDCLKTVPYAPTDYNQIVDIASFYVETRVNLDGRYDRNRGNISNIYVTEENFNKVNLAYSQQNKSNQSYIKNSKEIVNKYPNTVTWTLTKTFGESIDSWTHLTNTAMLDLDGNQGALTKLFNFHDTLLFFQEDAVGYIKYNENVALTTTSDLPIELANSGKVDGKIYLNREVGCQNKDTLVSSKNALYFIDGNTKSIYQIKDFQQLNAPQALTDNSFESFMQNQNLTCAKSFYNRNTQDIYFIFPDNLDTPCLAYNETISGFSSFYDYSPEFMTTIGTNQIHLKYNNESGESKLWLQNAGVYNYFYDFEYSPFYITMVATGSGAINDVIWDNIEFRSDSWKEDGTRIDETFDILNVWNEYQIGTAGLTTTGSFIEKDGSTITSYNLASTLKRKFRIWRGNFPRAIYNSNHIFIKGMEKEISNLPNDLSEITIGGQSLSLSRDRIRNPWCYFQLRKQTPNNYRTTLNDMLIYYYT